jgi:hypothetical protein
MNFEEAVKVVEDYAAGYGIKRGLLLDGLQLIRDEMSRDEELDCWLTQRQIAAYRIVCREMRPLFF